MSNYYYNMTQFIDIADSDESLVFYRRSIDYANVNNKITQKEYLQLLTQISKKEVAI